MKIVLVALLVLCLPFCSCSSRDQTQRLLKLKTMLQSTQKRIHSLRMKKHKKDKKQKKQHKKLRKAGQMVVSAPSKLQVAQCSSSSHQDNYDCKAGLSDEHAMTDKPGHMWKSQAQSTPQHLQIQFTRSLRLTGFRIRSPDDAKNRAVQINVDINGKSMNYKLDPSQPTQEFSFESPLESNAIQFNMVPDENNKEAVLGAAFQVLGDLDPKDIPQDISSVGSGMYAGCTSSETDNGCANAFTGKMVMDNKNMFINKVNEIGQVFFQVDFKTKVIITHIEAITDENRKVNSFQYLNSDKTSQTFTFSKDKTQQIFQLAKPDETLSARFVLQGGDSLAMGVQLYGLVQGPTVQTISDKAINPAVTCKSEGQDCQAALEPAMNGQGWQCTKDKTCYLDISLGADYDLTGFSIKQRQQAPLSLVSRYMVTVSGTEKKETEYKMDPQQNANRQTFHFFPAVSGNQVRFQVKTLSGNTSTNPLGGHISIYGHKKEDNKKSPSEDNELTTTQTPQDQILGSQPEDFFCEDYPIYL